MLDNISKMTKKMWKPLLLGSRTGTCTRRFQKTTGISDHTHFRFGNGAPLRINRFLDIMFSFSRSVTFSDATDEEPEKHVMRAALIEAVTTDSVTTIEKVTEIVKLTSSQREALGEDLSSAFDAGEVVLVQRVTTTKTKSPEPTAVINAYQILFSEDDDSTGDEDSGS